jgi:hypothetical protein
MESLYGPYNYRGRCGQDRMAVGFTTTCAISAYHYLSCEFEPRSWRGVLDTTLCDKVCPYDPDHNGPYSCKALAHTHDLRINVWKN